MATMEDETGGEESFDSTPHPEYEAIKAESGSASVSPIQEHLQQSGIELSESHSDKQHNTETKESDDEDYEDDDDNSTLIEDDVAENYEIKPTAASTATIGDDSKKNVMPLPSAITQFIIENSKKSANDMKKFLDFNNISTDETEMPLNESNGDVGNQHCYTVSNKFIGERSTLAKSAIHKTKKKNKSSKKEAREKTISTIMLRQNVPSIGMGGISTPKMLPVKTKDNKMVMVQLIEGTKSIQNHSFIESTPFAPATVTTTINTPITATEKVSPIKITMLPTIDTTVQSTLSQNQQKALRNNTPMSREFLALQRSVNESKVLSKFVTDTSVEKVRKRRKSGILPKEINNSGIGSNNGNGNGSGNSSSGSLLLEPATSALRRSSFEDNSTNSDITEHRDSLSYATGSVPPYQRHTNYSSEKRRKFTLIKDDEIIDPLKPSRRSRSKSVTESNLKKWPSDDKITMKRTNMRSQNSDFVQKQRDFLQRVRHQEGDVEDITDLEDYNDDQSMVGMEEDDGNSSLNGSGHCNYGLTRSLYNHHILDQTAVISGNTSTGGGDVEDSVDADIEAATGYRSNIESRLKGIWQSPPKPGWDSFCWKCRECGDLIPCAKCLRCYHTSCIKMTAAFKLDISIWVCPECAVVENVLNGPKRTRRHELSLDMLSQLLSFALKRMKNVKGQVLQDDDLLNQSKYVVNPVTFTTLQEKIEKKAFRCAEEFVNETKWILHNALILTYGTPNSKEVLLAKAILKVCRQEANEIDTCPECYLNANTRPDWFVDVCTQPHLLVWAKLKGFPYWPAKAMGLGQGSHVNVRFFGEHDRAFVPVKDCFLYSEQDPNMQTGKRSARELADCIKEVEVHIEKIRAKVGDFKYAPYKTPYDPNDEILQLELMMPGVCEYMRRQQSLTPKPSLQYKIVKTADNHLSIIKKPAVASESGNDSDTTHSSTPPMRKKPEKADSVEADVCTSGSSGVNSLIKSKPTTSKYEVISKAISDDSNSSKVSTVILKRKSISNSGERKRSDDFKVDVPLAKHSKPNEADVSINNDDIGCDESEMERENEMQKAKCTTISITQEPRVPSLTIKCAADIKESYEMPLETQAQDKAAISTTTTTTTAPTAQNSVEQLVKQKQGVTIKKIPKEMKRSDSVSTITDKLKLPCSNINTPKQSETSNSNSNLNANVEKIKDNKPLSDETSKNILKGLVPFIEPKKEIVSDEEDATNIAEESTSSVTAGKTIGQADAIQTLHPNFRLTLPSVNNETAASDILVNIKQEVLSDEEQQEGDELSANINHASMPLHSTPVSNEKTVAATTAASSTQTDGVRVVGGTTIQRITSKSASTSSLTSQQSGHNAGSIGGSSRRSTTRGVPYGPLPASAIPSVPPVSKTAPSSPTASTNVSTVSTSTNNSNNNTNNNSNGMTSNANTSTRHPSQRARKSFPNRSPSELCSSSLVGGYERSLLKAASMVSIPVDVVANRSVPVPPLTAVSKALPGPTPPPLPPASAVAVSSGITSSITPLTVQQQAVPQPPPPPPPSVSSSASTFCNGITGPMNAALLMSAPPPLAGLSQTPPQSIAPINTANPNSNNVEASTTLVANDAHLLSDLVTPTLASAITDVICRGPPKMLPRPDGPLQSEGSNMFPSQAGPVCRTLVENAHKLTDFFISVMEDTMREMTEGEEVAGLQAKITLLTMEMERKTQAYEKEIAELKRTSDLMLCEMRKSLENEKARQANEIRKQCEQERLRSIDETKKKQWCAHCGREAQFYCCWNTSYCDYPCQQMHWPRHATSCGQTRPAISNTETSNSKQTATTTTTANNNPQQEHRPHGSNKMLSSTSNTSTTNTQKSSSSSGSKKEKQHQHSKSGQNISATASTAALVAASQSTQPPPEVLKLPQNTYLRALPASTSVSNNVIPNSNGGGGGGSGSVSNNNNSSSSSMRNHPAFVQQLPFQVQRFNIPLPITAPVHPTPPYTLVQRGNNWELRPTTNSSNNSNSANSGNSSSTQSTVTSTSNMANIATPIASVPVTQQQQQQQQQHHHQHHHAHHTQQQTRLASGATITTNVKSSSNSSGRTRNSNAAAAAAASAALLNPNGSGIGSGLMRSNNQM